MPERCPLLDEVQSEIPLVCLEQCFDRYDAASQEIGSFDDYEADCTLPTELSAEVIAVDSLTKRRYVIVDQCVSSEHYPHNTSQTTWEFECPYGGDPLTDLPQTGV